MSRAANAFATPRRVRLAAATHFLLLTAVSLLRPVRDEMGLRAGVAQLPGLFTATLVAFVALVPLFGIAARRLPRRHLAPAVWLAVAAMQVGFWFALARGWAPRWTATTFFVAAAVDNLIVISAFWMLVADVASPYTARRTFPLIAAGGTLGALTGPAIVAFGAGAVGVDRLPLVVAALLVVATATAATLRPRQSASSAEASDPDRPIGGSPWCGVSATVTSPRLRRLAILLVFYSALSTYFYLGQAERAAAVLNGSAARASFFARVDLAVNLLALSLQVGLAARISRRWGAGALLALSPALVAIAIPWTAAASLLPFAGAYVLHRAGAFALFRPGREMIFAGAPLVERHQAKEFLDTTLYRMGDAGAAWLLRGFEAALGLRALAAFAVVTAVTWSWLGYRLGRRIDDERTADRSAHGDQAVPP